MRVQFLGIHFLKQGRTNLLRYIHYELINAQLPQVQQPAYKTAEDANGTNIIF